MTDNKTTEAQEDVVLTGEDILKNLVQCPVCRRFRPKDGPVRYTGLEDCSYCGGFD